MEKKKSYGVLIVGAILLILCVMLGEQVLFICLANITWE